MKVNELKPAISCTFFVKYFSNSAKDLNTYMLEEMTSPNKKLSSYNFNDLLENQKLYILKSLLCIVPVMLELEMV